MSAHATGTTPPQRHGTWLLAVRTAFVVVVVALLVRSIVVEWPRLGAALADMNAVALIGAVSMTAVAQVALWRSWHALLSGTGPGLPPHASAVVFFVGQLGKYAPGGLWTVVAQTELGATHRVPRARGAMVSVASLAVLIATGAGMGAVSVLATPGALDAYWWTLLLLVGGIVGLLPPVLNPLIRRVLRVVAPRVAPTPMTGRTIGSSVLWALGWWAAAGLHAWFLARALSPGVGPAVVVGAVALAWVVGLLVVIAPAGVGAREGALILLLGGTLGAADALALALVSRAIFILADALSAAVAAVHRRREPDRAGDDPTSGR